MNSHTWRRFEGRPIYPVADGMQRPDPNRFALKTVTSELLFNGTREIGIEHNGSLYRLKITRQGKLILNK